MSIIALALLLSAQSGPAVLIGDGIEQTDVAYAELREGTPDTAIAALEALRAENPDDPALLINLGSAYAEAGDAERAAAMYRAAEASEVRYRLELANGEWVDSRAAARLALRTLEERALAMR